MTSQTLPDRYPSYQTCHRRFQQWVRAGLLRSSLEVLAQALHDEGYLDVQEAFIDGSFAPAKQGGTCVGKTKRGKGSKIMAIADRQGLPIAVHVESATPHEVTLVRATLAERFVKPLPAHVERLFAWFQNFRRFVVHYERFVENFLGMLHLACWLILLRCL